ncbi:hypothetical protein P3X46_026596 [Hevea brasiliensis]|uniref:Uncharacterized protein n=1 Tax=Hevea brasiliensis TaxID=3981 RepID=A0ABQ9KYM2_HEVBR|nr:leucine-rich repeat extensin-like protein 6 [Hevea brasiliensis]KAJ9153119.1 hypothetical protein P3X46_026596 [Hevea brasiliensis]
MRLLDFLMLLNFFLLIAATPPIQALDSRKLDENTVPAPTDQKCAPCTSSPPPPPPPSPCPPPPALPPPALPPPTPKKPPSSYCPPPPASFIYITGPPGNLYPIDNDFGGADRPTVAGLPFLVGCGLLGFLLRYGV